MTQETRTIPQQKDPPPPTEAQIKGAATKSSLIEALGEAFSNLPGILEDGSYVENVGHSSPLKKDGVLIAKEEIDNSEYFLGIHELVILNREGIFRIRYVQKNASQPVVPTSMKEIDMEEYTKYRDRALEAIWHAPHGPQPQLNP